MLTPATSGLSRFALPLLALFAIAPLRAYDLVVTDPIYGRINVSASDYPRLYAVLTDPLAGGAIKTWFNPDSSAVEPVFLKAFVDTGASGIAISQLHASGLYDVASLGFTPAADYIGAYTETGVAGTEAGDVSRSFGVSVLSGPVDLMDYSVTSDYVPYGSFNLWVRRNVGAGEVFDLGSIFGDLGGDLGGLGLVFTDPINLVGMPVIRQRRLLLDATPIMDPLNAESGLGTYLLAPGEAEPSTQLTVSLVLHDFLGTTPPAGEIFPSNYANPLVSGVSLTHTGGTVTGNWLLDTGAGSSFASFATAKACGLIPANYATLADFMVTYTGRAVDIGGVGGALRVPILEVARLSVPTREGATLVWDHVDLLIADIAGLEGVFGLNLLLPSSTPDPANPLGSLDFSPGIFRHVVIDTTNAAQPVMRLDAPAADGTVLSWIALRFTPADRLNPAKAALLADPDGDGRPNLLEYALGSNPQAGDGPPTTGGTLNRADGKHGALTFTRPLGLTDVTYAVEASDDLLTWSRDAAKVSLAGSVIAGAMETVTFMTTDPLPATGRRFLRLVITPVP
ncbi:MAG: hypothetical protein RIQ79_1866 [Verrucomicrobiota bacterium]